MAARQRQHPRQPVASRAGDAVEDEDGRGAFGAGHRAVQLERPRRGASRGMRLLLHRQPMIHNTRAAAGVSDRGGSMPRPAGEIAMAESMRRRLEGAEEGNLAPYAMRSAAAVRRHRLGDERRAFEYRTHFQRDRDRIVYSRAFRRLRQKAQTGILPAYEDHRRNRLTHTLEVTQLARTIARALRLNEDLIEAIALAHDLGQPPFGPAGERALDDLLAGR